MSDKQNPEDFEVNRERLRDRVRAVSITSTAMENELVDVIVDELVTLRKRIADDIVGRVINRYEPGLSNEQLETLAWVIEYHVVAPDGSVDLAYPPPGARRGGLRSI
jgi:hypothetical protein